MQQLGHYREEQNATVVLESVTNEPSATTGMGRVSVKLDKGTVHAGTLMKGSVSVFSNKSDVEEILLKFECDGLIRLNADNGKTYSVHEVYLRDTMVVWKRRDKSEVTKGAELKIPFEYFISKDAKPSFDGHYAKVVYTCISVVKYAGALSRKQNDKRKFFVLPSSDKCPEICDDPMLKINKRKRFSSFGVTDGIVEVELEMDKSGVRRSESLGLTVSLKNESTLHLRSLKFGLLQIVESGAKGRQIIEKNPIVEFDENHFLLKPNEVWQGRRMCLIDESLQPSVETKGDKIACRVSYSIFVSVVPPNFASSCELTFPLVIY